MLKKYFICLIVMCGLLIADFTSSAAIKLIGARYTVGNMPGEFKVSQTGSAAYVIPISVSPGTADLAPLIKIAYSSHNGNGMLGVGFNLEGITSITRCASNLAKNGVVHGVDYTYDDRFCIDGEQLVAVHGSYGGDGTEYRTYIDSGSKIISYGVTGNGPAGFKVWTKNGQIAEYGFTNDAKLLAAGKQTIATWGLNKISDRAGNYLQVSYLQDNVNGAFYPEEINYTGNDAAGLNPYNAVKFIYQSRPDRIEVYRAGSVTRILQRLINIETYSNTHLLYSYKINYEQSPNTLRSRITYIQQCAGDGSCLPPTAFSWQTTTNPHWQENPQYALPAPIFIKRNKTGEFVDLTNHGLPDYVMATKTESNDANSNENYLRESWQNTGNGWVYAPNYKLPDVLYFHGHTAGTLADLTGSGRPDYIMSFKEPDSAQNWWARTTAINNGSGWAFAPASYLLPDVLTYFGGNSGEILDLNGDGLPDYVMAMELVSGVSNKKEFWKAAYINNGAGWVNDNRFLLPDDLTYNGHQAATLIDLNGDGLPDYVMSFKDHDKNNAGDFYWRKTAINTGSGFRMAGNEYLLPEVLSFEGEIAGTFVDLNGDGLPDYVLSISHKGEIWRGAWINTGAGWKYAPNYILPFSYSIDGKIVGTFADIAGSGLPAYIVGYDYGFSKFKILKTWINDGTTWREAPEYNLPDTLDKGVLVDVNGDGMVDYVMSTPDEHRTWLNTMQKPDLLTNITDGLNVSLNIRYRPLTDKNIYQRDDNAKYPILDLISPMYVVTQTKSATLSNDPKTRSNNDGMHITNYSYRGAKMHQSGLGFLGFRQVTATDLSTGISVATSYEQDVNRKLIGQEKSTETRLSSGALIEEKYNIWDAKQFGDGTLNHTYYSPYAKQISGNSYTLDGEFISSKKTTINVDEYNNPVATKTTAHDATGDYIFRTDNQYDNDPESWLIGSLRRTSVTASAPAYEPITRTTAYDYDKSGLLSSVIAEPDDETYRLTKEFKRDIFGNIIETTISGRGVQSRQSNSKYDATGRFISESRNALLHLTRESFDERFGKVKQSIDANGLQTNYQYDAFGRLIEEKRADGGKTNYLYDWDGGGIPGAVYSIKSSVLHGTTTASYFDQLQRQVVERSQGFSGKGIMRTIFYDDLGRIVRKSAPYFVTQVPHYTELEYDVLGRITKTIHPDGSQTKVKYDGLTTTVHNALGQVATKKINVRGDLLQATDNIGNSVNYFYDPLSNLIRTEDCKGNITTINYDKLGRRIGLHDPDKGLWQYKYNVFGELIEQMSPMQQKTQFQYDKLGRMISRSDQAGISAWEYDTALHGIGMLSKVNGVSGNNGKAPNANEIIHARQDGLINYQRSNKYDELSRQAETKITINNNEYISSISYDKDSRPITETFPSGLKIEKQYDDLGFFVKIYSANGIYWQLNSMDATGRVTSETHHNALTTDYTYDPNTQYLNSIITTKNKPGLKKSETQHLEYSYDALGNIKSRSDLVNNLNEEFTYDSLNRLTEATSSNNQTVSWQYDPVGNIILNSELGNYKYAENGAGPHALTSVDGKSSHSTFKYNPNGDQIEANINGAKRSMSYTSYSKPFSIMNDKGSTIFYYNADRDRFQRIDRSASGNEIVTLFLGDYEIVNSYEKGKKTVELKHYIGPSTMLVKRIPSAHNSSKVFTVLHDNLGSVTDITDESGQVLQHFYYKPFGERKLISAKNQDVLTKYGFTGHEQVEFSNLVHMDGRIYDPIFGRFLSADPFVQNPDDQQVLNRYSYCINNPLRYTDPTGYNFFGDVADAIGGMVHFIGVGLGHLAQNEVAREAIMTTVGIVSGGTGIYLMPLCSSMMTAASGGDFAGMIKSASLTFVSMCTASITDGITADFGKAGGWQGLVEKSESVLIHGSTGGIISSMQGGKFKDGFIAAAVADAGSNYIENIGKNNFEHSAIMERSIAAGIIGGTAASLSGGKFSRGMATAIFAEMYQDEVAKFNSNHSATYSSEKELALAMGPNAIVFGDRKLEVLPFTFRDPFLNAVHLIGTHKEIYYTDAASNLYHVGFNSGAGIHPDEVADAGGISKYKFGSITRGVQVTDKTFQVKGFTARLYNLFFHNCQYYAYKVAEMLHIPAWAV